MRFLFLHSRYPAQFMNLLHYLAGSEQNEVVFICQFKRNDIDIPNVRVKQVSTKQLDEKIKASEKSLLRNYYNAEFFASEMINLQKEGFIPDVVFDHCGWGCGMYVQDIFPNTARICYCEWFYTKKADYQFFSNGKTLPPAAFSAHRQQNLCQLDALKDCDVAVSPTFWQASQYPTEFLYKFRIIHDGVDTDFFSPLIHSEAPDEVSGDYTIQGLDLAVLPEIVSYATRGMEPYRGFPQFFRSIPKILASRPQAHVVIMADDEVYYGTERPDGKSWGTVMQEEVDVDPQRVHFLHFDSYFEYRKLLRATSVHIYLTAPFVLSWSLLEALSCGCLVVASDTLPVREIIRHAENGFLTSFWDSEGMGNMITHILENRDKYSRIRQAARALVEERYSTAKTIPQLMLIMQEAAAKKRILLNALQANKSQTTLNS